MKVLVVDDTIVFRKIISDSLLEIPGVEIVGSASNGKIALTKIMELKPDIITLDIEMPVMNGIEVLEEIKKERINIGVIVLSAVTVKGGEMTIKALQLGAFDFITKPDSGTVADNRAEIRDNLSPIIKALEQKNNKSGKQENIRNINDLPVTKSVSKSLSVGSAGGFSASSSFEIASFLNKMKNINKPEIIVIGVSTGGPAALAEMLPKIPSDIGVPILIVQHMPPLFTKSLAKSLDSKCKINVKEGEEGEKLLPGTAFIAPGGKHMKISASASGKDYIIRITDDPPENNCKPAVDYLFRSVSSLFPGKITAVVMTGMGNDGTLGMRLIKRQGSVSITQDQKSCVVYGMPMEVVKAGVSDLIVPLELISTAIEKSIKMAGF